jgi:hypothetical protein
MRLVGAVAFSLGLTLAACGGSSGRETPDAAAGSGGRAGSGGGVAGAAPSGTGGAAGDDGGGRDARDAEASASLPDAPDAGEDARLATDTGHESVAMQSSCAPVAIDAPAAQVTILDNGKAVDEDGFLGGAIASGTWVLTQVVHFGAAYAGPTRALWIVDAAARTLDAAWLDGETATSVRYALANASPAVLTGFPSCGASAPSNWNYLVTDAGLSVNLRGSSDVLLFTRQAASVVGP